MIRLPGARLRKAQIATLATFIAMGHAALSSVAWVPEYIARLDVSFATWGTIVGFGRHRFDHATFVRVEIDYEVWL